MVKLEELVLGVDTPLAIPSSVSYRPPSWPPTKDWPCVVDKDGNVVSRWGDSVWRLFPWCGKNKVLNFGDGPNLNRLSPRIDPVNADFLRLLVTWRIWGPRGAASVNTIITDFFVPIRKIISLCSRNEIKACDLARFPALFEEVAKELSPSRYNVIIGELDRIADARNYLGFVLLESAGIQRLKAMQPDHHTKQTPYMPPRIWEYQVVRLKECLDDYLEHQTPIENCFAYCREAYEMNGVPQARAQGFNSAGLGPFQDSGERTGARSGLTFRGSFVNVAQRFGIKEVIEKWVGELRQISGFSHYFKLVVEAGLLYILNFTLMRSEEAISLGEDCLKWEDDEVFGRIPLIRGKTTKTVKHANAVWITTPSVETAIRVMRSVNELRLSCIGKRVDETSHLVTHSIEHWSRPSMAELQLRPVSRTYRDILSNFPLLLERDSLIVTEEDLRIARSVDPSLDPEKFQVGKPWPLAKHQLRRTGAVNMVASPNISDSSVQLQLKHLTRCMTLYYGRGNTRLHLNEAARVELVNEQYKEMGRKLAAIHFERFICPHGEEHKQALLAVGNNQAGMRLVSEHDAVRYEKAARAGKITFRRTTLGGCMNNGKCGGDCIESVADCAGGNGKAPCAHVLFDRERAGANQLRLEGVNARMAVTPSDTPEHRALEQERLGLENYFAYVNGY